MDRIDKCLSGTGRWSRKEVKALLRAGRVTVNGVVARDPGEKVSPEMTLCVDGEVLNTDRLVYLMMNKPAGLISSTEDPRERTVLELLSPELRKLGLFPVGRLDKDTEGLLLLTNDGPLAHHLLSPRHHVEKVYFVKVRGELVEEDVTAFAQGLTLRDGTVCKPAGLRILGEDSALVRLYEGKYHQVKRMMAARGKLVVYLKRLSMGSLQLDEGLEAGQWRHLSEEELRELKGSME